MHPYLSKNFFNGVLVESFLHRDYHSMFGKDPGSVNPKSFLRFIDSLKGELGIMLPRKTVLCGWKITLESWNLKK